MDSTEQPTLDKLIAQLAHSQGKINHLFSEVVPLLTNKELEVAIKITEHTEAAKHLLETLAMEFDNRPSWILYRRDDEGLEWCDNIFTGSEKEAKDRFSEYTGASLHGPFENRFELKDALMANAENRHLKMDGEWERRRRIIKKLQKNKKTEGI